MSRAKKLGLDRAVAAQLDGNIGIRSARLSDRSFTELHLRGHYFSVLDLKGDGRRRLPMQLVCSGLCSSASV